LHVFNKVNFFFIYARPCVRNGRGIGFLQGILLLVFYGNKFLKVGRWESCKKLLSWRW